MGGGQANSGQAKQAAVQQTAASNQDMALSKQNQAEQSQLFGTLFGKGGTSGGGTLSGMLDPNSLTQKGFNPAYTAQWNQAQDQIAKNYQQQRGSLAQAWANQGAGSNSTPSGFQADQMRKLSSSEADTRGADYATLKGQQYQDALNNFWNASNIASGNAATATQGALTGSGNSGSSSATLYGTAGQYHPSQAGQIIGSALGAGGTVGAAAAGKPPKPGCWIAEAIYGVDDPRTLLLPLWLNTEFTKQWTGRMVMWVYVAVGQQTAWAVRRSRVLRAVFRPLFERALQKARAWELQSILDKYGVIDSKDLELQLSDSQVLYKVGNGEISVAALMTCFTRMWPKPTMDNVAQELKEWLFEKGYLTVPDRERIFYLFAKAVENLCEQSLIPRNEWPTLVNEVAKMIDGDWVIINQISRGNLETVDGLFAKVCEQRTGTTRPN